MGPKRITNFVRYGHEFVIVMIVITELDYFKFLQGVSPI
jgi:hypothetical protein